ncbi:MAG TPA: hypothetical protein VKM55_06215 [Candidatus Lokiarchaeia archaeon]|nr:hypothetical protein [Candidatus Lokiarchaeia archaeon]
MTANFTLNVVLASILVCVMVYSFTVSVNQIRKDFNYRFYWFAAITWILFAIANLCVVVALLFSSVEYLRFFGIFCFLTGFFGLMMVDTLKHEQVEPVKLAAYLVLLVLFIISAFLIQNAASFAPDIFGGEGITLNPVIGLLTVAGTGIVWVYITYCAYLVNKRAPAAIRRYSHMYFVGAFTCLTAIISLLSLSYVFNFILLSAGISLMAYAYGHEPKLLFILPFKAIRLTILETEGGISLFTHTWNRHGDLADEDLFSGVLQGVNGILKESLKRGDVTEIHMADAIIIAYRNPEYPIAFMLVATRPSRTLRDALKIFAERFLNEFHDRFATLNDVSQFSGGENLVTECFPNVPVYD